VRPDPPRILDHLRPAAARSLGDPGSDAALLDRYVRERDGAAFAALLARHGPMVLRVCHRVVGDPHRAEDAFQAAFLVLARRAAAVRPPEALAAWLHGVAYRVALKARAGEARRCRREVPAADFDPADPRADPLAEVSARELLAAVDEEVRRLPQAYRLPVILCCLEGKTQEEAARRLGWTPGALQGRLERGRKRLHARLVRRGLTLTAAAAAVEVSRAAAARVPGRVLVPTARAALLIAAGKAVSPDPVTAEVVTLMEGVLNAMLRARLKTTAAVLVILGILGVVTGALLFRAAADEPALPARQVAAGSPAQDGGAAPGKPAAAPGPYALILIEDLQDLGFPVLKGRALAGAGDPAAYRRTQVVLLRSRPNLRAALGKAEVASLAILKTQADPLGWLEKNVEAVLLDNTDILRVSIGAGSEAERAALANAVAAAYVERTNNEEREQKVQRLDALRDLLAEHERRLQQSREVLRKVAQQTGTDPSGALRRQFEREDLAHLRGELQQTRAARIRAQARLNYRRSRPAGEKAKEVIGQLEEEVGVLAEQEKLLRQEIDPLTEAAVRNHAETTAGGELVSLRDEVAAAEQMTRRVAEQVEGLQMELRAAPRVRLLEKAEASRPGK
jgi:RNA polymerase sigma factor (sigma-70 family)